MLSLWQGIITAAMSEADLYSLKGGAHDYLGFNQRFICLYIKRKIIRDKNYEENEVKK